MNPLRRNQQVAAVLGLFLLLRKCLRLLSLVRQAALKQRVMKALPVRNVSEVIEYLKQHPTVKSVEYFVQGVIRSEHPFRSVYNKAQKLVCDVVLGSYLYSNNHQEIIDPLEFKDKFILAKPRLAPSLKLSDLSDKAISGNIKLLPQVSISQALSELHTENVRLEVGLLGRVWAFFAELIKNFFFYLRRFVKGSRITLVKHELGIKQGQFVNVAATCSLDMGVLNLHISTMVKQSYMFHERMARVIAGHRLYLLGFSLFTAVYVVLLWKLIKPTLLRALTLIWGQPASSSEQMSDGSSDSEDNKFTCYICCNRVVCMIFKPCKHFGVCKTCYLSLESKNCPICKREIEGVIEVNKRR